MARLSFKDVGVRADVARQNVLERNRSILPIGIKTPLELLDDSGAIFKMHFSIQEQIRDNLRNLLLTNHGERIALFNFGANLRPLLTEYTNKDDFDSEAMIRISTAIRRWMPFVTPDGFESFPDFFENQFTGRIRIIVVYSVSSLNINGDIVEVNLFVI